MFNNMAMLIESYGEWAHGGNINAVAQEWLDAGFELEDAREWLDAGCWDAKSAMALREAGMAPEQAGQYTEIGGCPARIGDAVSNNDLRVEEAMALI